ncbi:MAG: terminase family protein [Actinomycetota bacterium]|nr:terminase family protein [Actinomycetota bacterium]
MTELSQAQQLLAEIGPEEWERRVLALSPTERKKLYYNWPFWARPSQLRPEGDWRTVLYLAGRGWGKTRVGAEDTRSVAESGLVPRIALVAETAADARDVMVEGESGILSVSPPWFKPNYEPSKRRITWPNGVIAQTFSAEDPDQLRGPQSGYAWCDEMAKWKYPDETWSNLQLGLRLGAFPRNLVTTTPRPTELVKRLVGKARNGDTSVAVVTGTTYDNLSNLAPTFRDEILETYEGTRLGRQELYADILDDVPGALWNHKMLDELRVRESQVPWDDIFRVVIGVDPSTTTGERADETGIAVVALATNNHAYVLGDESLRASPRTWARAVVEAYEDYSADMVIGETNNGGDMVAAVIRSALDPGQAMPRYKKVHASRGKRVRAEPIAALYEQGRVHHVGIFKVLEDQMTTWVPDMPNSPDRLDALVWALTELQRGKRHRGSFDKPPGL